MRSIRPYLLLAAIALATLVGLSYWFLTERSGRNERLAAVRTMEFWKDAYALPLEKRTGEPPREVLEWANAASYGEHRAMIAESTQSPQFARELEEALAGLPPEVLRAARGKVAGIYALGRFRGSGMALPLLDARGQSAGGVILLDARYFEARTGNEMLSWALLSPFAADASGLRLRAEIAHPREDSRVRALQYVLLHEIGHVLGFGTALLPPLQNPDESFRRGAFAYLDLSWRPAAQWGYVPVAEQNFTGRERLQHFGESTLPLAQLPNIYDGLSRTSLPTIYGASNPWEDFAEAFATYVHVKMMQRPYVLRVYEGGRQTREYRSCWEEKRCENRRRYMRQVLGLMQD